MDKDYEQAIKVFGAAASQVVYDLSDDFMAYQAGVISAAKLTELIMAYLAKKVEKHG